MGNLPYSSQSVITSDKALNGGLNSTAGPLTITDRESSDLQNIDFSKFGSIKKRNGYACLNTSSIGAVKGDGLFWYEYDVAGATTRYAVKASGGKFYKMDSLDGTWDDITGALTVTATYMCDFDNFLNEVYVTNGYDVPFKWNGSSNASAMTVPTGLTTAKFVKLYNNYLFLANVTVAAASYPSRLYWSNLKDTSTWDSAAWIEVSKDDGQAITGIRVLSDRLVVYKERSIYNLFFTGDADIPFIMPGGGKSNSSVGCIAFGSICDVENGHVFLSSDGLYFYDGSNSYKISDKINTTLYGLSNTTLSTAVAINYKKFSRYMIALTTSGGTTHNRVLVWDYFNNAFSIYIGMACADMAMFYPSGSDERPYFSDYLGYTYRMDTGNSDYPENTQTAINAYYYTNWKYYEDVCDQKGIPSIYIYYQSSNSILTFAYSYDFENADQYSQTFSLASGTSVYGTALYGTGIYGGSGGNVVRRDLDGRGRVIRFKFANSTIDETFTVDGFGTIPYLETQI